MTGTPWTVTSKKRKSTPSVQFTGRKRLRSNDILSSDSRRQQTLTQAQWVNRGASFNEEIDMTPLVPAISIKRESLKKRNSTLTQMPFFATAVKQQEEDLELIGSENGYEDAIPPILQLDGTYQSPRRPRKRRAVSVLKTESTESQEYQPTKKSRKHGDNSPQQPRRSSRRVAQQTKILSDPAENLDYFSEALKPVSPQKLEIQDSTADTEIVDLTTQSPAKTPARPPLAHSGMTVPSSQTPDSVGYSTSGTSGRRPLTERSANARMMPSEPQVYKQSPFGKKASVSVSNSALKKPTKTIIPSKIEDSQASLWSIQPTSSASRPAANLEEIIVSSPPEPMEVPVAADAEIPSTSQAQPCKSIASPPIDADAGNAGDPGLVSDDAHMLVAGQQSRTDESAEICASTSNVTGGEEALDAISDSRSSLLSKSQGSPTPRLERISHEQVTTIIPQGEETDDDFGSPIRNDTQYNQEITERTSSPAPSASRSISADNSRHATPVPATVNRTENSSGPLIERTSFIHSMELPPAPPLPPPPPSSGSIPGYTTTRIPLNDTLPSSSPSHPSHKSITQRSVRPASMPHPSQISTQEATQGYAGSSFMPPEMSQITQRITVKDDSSSLRLPMSQIPQQPASQPALDINLGFDDGVEDEDYDLDPPSSGVTRQFDLPTDAAGAEPQPLQNPPDTQHLPSRSPSPSPSPAKEVTEKVNDHDPDDDLDEPYEHQPPPHPQPIDRPTKPSQHPSKPKTPKSSKPPPHGHRPSNPSLNPAPADRRSPQQHNPPITITNPDPPSSPPPSSPNLQPTPPPPLPRPLSAYTQLEGYNNDTQSNFTQGGHVTAAYVHRQRELGLLPKGFTPRCFRVPGFTRR